MKTEFDLSKLTQEHIQELDKEPNIHEMFVRIGVVKNQLEVGKWYKRKNALCFYLSDESQYGIHNDGTWIKDAKWLCDGVIRDSELWIEATPEEVTKRLIEYAKSIGFVKGAKFKSVEPNIYGESVIEFGNISCEFYFDKFNIYNSCGWVFKDGIWAELISEPIPQEETYIKIPLSEIKATKTDAELVDLVRSISGIF
jgi:hypothetical protein